VKGLDARPQRPGARTKGRYEGGAASSKKDERPLGQTIDYEGLEGSASAYDGFTDEQNDSAMKRDDVAERPIYVKDDPVPRPKNIGGRGMGKVFASGESFGPLNRSSGGMQEKIRMGKNGRNAVNERDRIAEDFLENDDDLQESGEINPAMFR